MVSNVTAPFGGPLTVSDGSAIPGAGPGKVGAGGVPVGARAMIRIRRPADLQLLRSRRSRIRLVSSAHASSKKLPGRAPDGTVSVLTSRARVRGFRARSRGRGRRRKSPRPLRLSRDR